MRAPTVSAREATSWERTKKTAVTTVGLYDENSASGKEGRSNNAPSHQIRLNLSFNGA